MKGVKKLKGRSLDELLEDIQIQEIDAEVAEINNTEGIIGWYGVCNHRGIIAYFGEESDAFRFRLDYINQILNTI